MDYKILKGIIELAEEYQESMKTDIWQKEQFVSWVLQSSKQPVISEKNNLPPQDGLIGMFLGFMYKYSQFYARRIFRNTKVYSLDDFAVLVTLFPENEFKKTEVMKRCIMEKASGNEVLKRLLREGLVLERDNPADARSKLLSLTDLGKEQYLQIQKGIEKLGKHVVGGLDSNEKSQMLEMLFKLHHFHLPYFEENDEMKLNEILF